MPALGAQTVKRLLARRETRVRSLSQEDSLEKEMATHSSTLARKIPWTEESGRLYSMGSQRVKNTTLVKKRDQPFILSSKIVVLTLLSITLPNLIISLLYYFIFLLYYAQR